MAIVSEHMRNPQIMSYWRDVDAEEHIKLIRNKWNRAPETRGGSLTFAEKERIARKHGLSLDLHGLPQLITVTPNRDR